METEEAGAMDALSLYGLLALTTAPPLVPNSALLVTAGVLASQGGAHISLVLLIVAGSALLGDLLMHVAARRFGGPVRAWMLRRARRRALLEWTSAQIQRYGLPFVVAVRFLPSGRIVGALASGVVRYSLRRYALGAGIAEAVWAAYSVGLGYLGTAAVADTLFATLVGVGVSVLVATVGAAAQWVVRSRATRPRRARLGASRGTWLARLARAAYAPCRREPRARTRDGDAVRKTLPDARRDGWPAAERTEDRPCPSAGRW
ncbi:VTT domain-containing protein [Streptomyces sp. NPDC003077]|uniref:DedA family protein n=1 Tax=Streptomyces sp. NPDC003077 TaxID=3154443 RepID=UPI0033BE07DF